jgi:hypothetical protein
MQQKTRVFCQIDVQEFHLCIVTYRGGTREFFFFINLLPYLLNCMYVGVCSFVPQLIFFVHTVLFYNQRVDPGPIRSVPFRNILIRGIFTDPRPDTTFKIILENGPTRTCLPLKREFHHHRLIFIILIKFWCSCSLL